MEQEAHVIKGWWYIRFRIKWPENSEPLWHVDLMLAHKILAPIIDEHQSRIDFWRFHRRAARDVEGHQFSLTCYSTPDTAEQICNLIKSNPFLKRIKRAGLIIQDIYDDPEKIGASNIWETSDGRWSLPIKKSWPYFIMGICEMWLNLIRVIAEDIPTSRRPSLLKTLAFYQQVNDVIRKAWQEEGSHSLLHHLNAIFGYEPLLIHEVNLKRF